MRCRLNLSLLFQIVTLFLILCLFPFSLAEAQTKKKKPAKPPCKPTLAKCPATGCGVRFDPDLNRRKNIRSDDQTPTVRTLRWVKNLDDPENFTRQNTNRDELATLGEGQMITVVAYLLVARKGGKESCNCGLSAAKDTDNHLVLVDRATLDNKGATKKETLDFREEDSVTAEFTPRVRRDHPNFVRTNLQSRIDAAPENALLVRVTGLLLFDSEHFLGHHLKRHNNWEIHPILKMEFCQTGTNCKANSDTGWKSLDDL